MGKAVAQGEVSGEGAFGGDVSAICLLLALGVDRPWWM